MKNYLMVSPHYPQRLYKFATSLAQNNFQVLGIGDVELTELNRELRDALTGYMNIDLHCYDNRLKIKDGKMTGYDESQFARIIDKLNWLESRFGKIDYVDSLNEWWLPLDAMIREELDLEGVKPRDLEKLVRKSSMKNQFKDAGVFVTEHLLIDDKKQAVDFFDRYKDVILKPDWGVGANNTRRATSRLEVEYFLDKMDSDVQCIMEPTIKGSGRRLLSFDGITDKDGDISFYTVHEYNNGILEIVENGDLCIWNCVENEIPRNLIESGINSVKSFNLKKQCFHIEFFYLPEKDKLYGLEINARPPGVNTVDIMNFAYDIDFWNIHSNIMNEQKIKVDSVAKRYAGTCSRKNHRDYLFELDEVKEMFHTYMRQELATDSAVMGDYSILITADTRKKWDFVRRSICTLK